eukprot:SM000086S23079  [mRNA]  locus=s86:518414:522368:- [translate_table: standard]
MASALKAPPPPPPAAAAAASKGDAGPYLTADVPVDPGERRLQELGYKQELRRSLNLLEILGIAVSVINPYITIIPLYSLAISYGGPLCVMWPWWPVAFSAICVGLCLSEICSSFPTTGSMYFWAASLAPPKLKPIVSWITAWFEVVAVTVSTASVAFPAAQIIQQTVLLMSGTGKDGGYFFPKGVFFAVYAALLFSWAFVNSLSAKNVSVFTTCFLYFNIVFTPIFVSAHLRSPGTQLVRHAREALPRCFLRASPTASPGLASLIPSTLSLGQQVIMLPLVAPTNQRASYVYFHYENSSVVTGVTSVGVNWMFAMLMPQFCFYGYDAAAHITEETKLADSSGPKAIMGSIFVEIVFGYAILNALTFSIQACPLLGPPSAQAQCKLRQLAVAISAGYWGDLFDPTNETLGLYPPAQIIYAAFYGRYGSGAGAYVVLLLIIIPFYASGKHLPLDFPALPARSANFIAQDKAKSWIVRAIDLFGSKILENPTWQPALPSEDNLPLWLQSHVSVREAVEAAVAVAGMTITGAGSPCDRGSDGGGPGHSAVCAGVAGLVAASRAIYAASRDGALPGSTFWRRLDPHTKVPVRASWLIATIATLIGLPIFGTQAAFNAIVSVATIAWVATYAFPIFFRMVMPPENFVPGPFFLGKFSRPLCFLSMCYIIYTILIFSVPLTYPITWKNFNYGPIGERLMPPAPPCPPRSALGGSRMRSEECCSLIESVVVVVVVFVAVVVMVVVVVAAAAAGVVLAGALIWFAVDAHRWFTGPIRTIDIPTMHGRDILGDY